MFSINIKTKVRQTGSSLCVILPKKAVKNFVSIGSEVELWLDKIDGESVSTIKNKEWLNTGKRMKEFILTQCFEKIVPFDHLSQKNLEDFIEMRSYIDSTFYEIVKNEKYTKKYELIGNDPLNLILDKRKIKQQIDKIVPGKSDKEIVNDAEKYEQSKIEDDIAKGTKVSGQPDVRYVFLAKKFKNLCEYQNEVNSIISEKLSKKYAGKLDPVIIKAVISDVKDYKNGSFIRMHDYNERRRMNMNRRRK